METVLVRRRFHPRTARGRADDFVILCRTAADAEAALELVQAWVETNGLTLHPEKTRLVDATAEGFDFLGYHFRREHRWPRKKSLAKLRATLRAKTKRTDGRSPRTVIADVNATLRGWFEYFRHSIRWTFPALDGWVRMRLRSMLRKRTGRRGRSRGTDRRRWPNSFFARQGLYSLVAAHAVARRSSGR